MMEETVSRIQRRNTSRADLQDTYSKLNAFIDVPPSLLRSSTKK
jgi:c-di-GMP-binding flagellar brake protein YcgR